ncbi:MAG: ABC transporter substrate-binding protein, partial [Sphingomonadales bacterium]
SFDYCADQHVLALAEPGQIAALSKYQLSDFSYFKSGQKPYPEVKGSAEEALALQVDVVIRAFGGGPALQRLVSPFGIEVVTLGYGSSLEAGRENLLVAGRALGREAAAKELLRQTDARLSEVRTTWQDTPEAERPSAIYLTPSGATTGSGTFVDDVITAAGFRNAASADGKTGWHMLDIESLITTPPDAIIAAFFDLKSSATNNWSLARHHLIRRLMEEKPTVMVPGRLISCTSWTAVEAVEMINRLYLKVAGPKPDREASP